MAYRGVVGVFAAVVSLEDRRGLLGAADVNVYSDR